MGGPGALLIGETQTFNGREVARVGLHGDGAYLVDGQPCSLDAAAALVSVRAPVPQLDHGLAPSVPALVAAPRGRRSRVGTRRAERATFKVSPELLEEVRQVLGKKPGVSYVHRTFSGGEAVTVKIDLGAGAPTAERVISMLVGSGLHAERAPDGSVVAAWTKGVLSGDAGKVKR